MERYEKFFCSRLERKYDSLFQINLLQELSKWDDGFPRTIAHHFSRYGYPTVGDMASYFSEDNPRSIRNLGVKRLEVAKKLVKKYRSESLINPINSCNVYSYSKTDYHIDRIADNIELPTYPYYLTNIEDFNNFDTKHRHKSKFSVTMINTSGEYNVVINVDDQYEFEKLSKEQSFIKMDDGTYYKLLNSLNMRLR